MKVSIFEIKDWQKEYLQNSLQDGLEISFHENVITPTKDADTEILSVFTGSKLDSKILKNFPKLKFIATRSTGYDHIDLDYCKEKGILVSNVPSYGENTVAEHAFALLLSISKRIPESVERTRRSNFDYEELTGFDLKGKTLGVIGTGRIGTHSIKIGLGFGMNILATDPFPKEDLAKKMGFKYVSLEDLLKNSDVITIHVPLLKETRHLINEGNINLIKRGAVLINTARGAVVETDALIKALNDGIISAAGLDVLEGEHFLRDEMQLLSKENKITLYDYKTLAEGHFLMDRPNVIVTPHNAFNTKEAMERILRTTVDNIKGFAQNKPINLVSAK